MWLEFLLNELADGGDAADAEDEHKAQDVDAEHSTTESAELGAAAAASAPKETVRADIASPGS